MRFQQALHLLFTLIPLETPFIACLCLFSVFWCIFDCFLNIYCGYIFHPVISIDHDLIEAVKIITVILAKHLVLSIETLVLPYNIGSYV